MKTTPFAIAAALSLTLGSALVTVAPAHAAETRQIEVSYDDLNLETEAGRHTLERRLDYAARKVCDYDGVTTGARGVTKQAKDCYAKARSLTSGQVAAIMERQNLGG